MTKNILDEKTTNALADILIEKAKNMEYDEYGKFLKDFNKLKFTDFDIVQKYISDNSINKAIE